LNLTRRADVYAASARPWDGGHALADRAWQSRSLIAVLTSAAAGACCMKKFARQRRAERGLSRRLVGQVPQPGRPSPTSCLAAFLGLADHKLAARPSLRAHPGGGICPRRPEFGAWKACTERRQPFRTKCVGLAAGRVAGVSASLGTEAAILAARLRWQIAATPPKLRVGVQIP
jgi:hypothetical protein